MSTASTSTDSFKDGRSSNRFSRFNKTNVIIGVLGVLSISLFIAVVTLAQKPRTVTKTETQFVQIPRDPRECRTATCHRLVDDMKSYMDETVKPCDDFYNYACGNWKKRHPANDSFPETVPLALLQMKTLEKLSELLRDLPVNSKPRGIASFLYRSCVSDSNNTGKDELMKVIAQFDGWPILSNPPPFETENLLMIIDYTTRALKRFNLKVLFNFQVIPNMFEPEKFILSINKGPYISQLNRDPFPTTTNYVTVDWIEKLVCFLNPDCGTLYNLREEIEEIKEMDIQMRNVLPVYSFENNYADYAENLNVTLAELDVIGPLLDTGRDWHQIVKVILNNDSIGYNYKVLALGNPIRGIVRVLRNYNIRTVKNWFILQVLMQLGPRFSRLFRSPLVSDEVRCAQEVHRLMPYAAVEIYNIHWSRIPGRKEMADKLFREVRKVIFGFAVSDWLDQDTSQKIIRKLENIIPHLGFPDWILDENELSKYYPITLRDNSTYADVVNALLALEWPRDASQLQGKLDRKTYWIKSDLLQANAWFAAWVNTMTIPIGILEYPFLTDVTSPRSVIYGILGHIVAHEIFHGLDPQGILADANGQLASPYGKRFTQMYTERIMCILNQYNKFTSNGQRTITEDFADVGAVETVFKAYRDRTSTDDIFFDDTLPNFNRTLDKQFFISYASTWCNDITNEMLPVALKDIHSRGRFRVNVPLMNSPEFSEVFQCPKGSFMNPERKCRVFN